LIGESTRSSIG